MVIFGGNFGLGSGLGHGCWSSYLYLMEALSKHYFSCESVRKYIIIQCSFDNSMPALPPCQYVSLDVNM